MDRRSLLALFLIFMVLMLWKPYMEFMNPTPEQTEMPENMFQIPPDTSVVIQNEPAAQTAAANQVQPEGQTVGSLVKTDIEERKIIIETDLYRGVISTKGGTVEEWVLKEEKYQSYQWDELNLIRDNEAGNLGITFFSREGFNIDFRDFDFIPENMEESNGEYLIDLTRTGSSGSRQITITADLGDQRYIRKRLTFDRSSYNVMMDIEFDNLNSIINNQSYQVTWGSGMRNNEKNPDDNMGQAKSIALYGTDVEKFDVGSSTEFVNNRRMDGTVHWIATKDKYFSSVIIPVSAKGTGYQANGQYIPGATDIGTKHYVTNLFMGYSPTGRIFTDRFLVYLGPIEYYLFKDIGESLGEDDLKLTSIVLDVNSFIKPLSLLIYRIFRFLHGFIPNYGFVIIIFSLLLNLAMYPLTAKSYRSIKKMQGIQPVLTELKEKYKDEPQKFQQAQMKYFKENKINPLGGCLPMLFQMPVFFAIYPIFRTIELRGAPFLLWVKDLSSPDAFATLPFSIPFYGDSFNLLTVIYAVMMFLQQKVMVNDPKQKAMIYIMPFMMLVLLNRLSSGFILYFIIFLLLSIAQRFLVRDGEVETVPAAKNVKTAVKAKPAVKNPKGSGKKTKKK
ncbi:MAG: membrane protein insertase YidC [bacterium]|nr:membrane protein insertase YidC [bacterium]